MHGRKIRKDLDPKDEGKETEWSMSQVKRWTEYRGKLRDVHWQHREQPIDIHITCLKMIYLGRKCKTVSTCTNPTVTQGNLYRQKQWEIKDTELKRSKF